VILTRSAGFARSTTVGRLWAVCSNLERRGTEATAASFSASRSAGSAIAGLAEEVFTRAWRNAGAFDATTGSVRAWLYGLAPNAVIDVERPSLAQAPLTQFEVASVEEPIENALVRLQLQKAFDGPTPSTARSCASGTRAHDGRAQIPPWVSVHDGEELQPRRYGCGSGRKAVTSPPTPRTIASGTFR
jgi:hypothetical protein